MHIFKLINSSHHSIKIHSRMHPIEPYHKQFLEEHILNFLAIKLHIVTVTHRKRDVLQYPTSPSSQKDMSLYSTFEHGLLPLINDHSFRHPSTDNEIVWDHIMSLKRSHKRKFPTTPLVPIHLCTLHLVNTS